MVAPEDDADRLCGDANRLPPPSPGQASRVNLPGGRERAAVAARVRAGLTLPMGQGPDWRHDTAPDLDGQPESGREELVDDVAALLLAADGGDETAERKLAQWYASDPRLHPGEQVRCMSPSGTHTQVNLRTREQLAAV